RVPRGSAAVEPVPDQAPHDIRVTGERREMQRRPAVGSSGGCGSDSDVDQARDGAGLPVARRVVQVRAIEQGQRLERRIVAAIKRRTQFSVDGVRGHSAWKPQPSYLVAIDRVDLDDAESLAA